MVLKEKMTVINGVIIKDIEKYSDERGFLIEAFRIDNPEINEIYCIDDGTYSGVPMSYISSTLPNVSRGPHEHEKQTDVFLFVGSSNFKIRLWDNRPESETYKNKMEIIASFNKPVIVIIPPGVIHGYKNIGKYSGYVLNFPNKLYKGWNKNEEIDEIRWEDDKNSPFTME